jgi:hypothetical protein
LWFVLQICLKQITFLVTLNSHKRPLHNSKSNQIHNFIKICSVIAEMFHADTQRDMKKLRVAFRKYGNVVKLSCILWHRIFRNFNSPRYKYLNTNFSIIISYFRIITETHRMLHWLFWYTFIHQQNKQKNKQLGEPFGQKISVLL